MIVSKSEAAANEPDDKPANSEAENLASNLEAIKAKSKDSSSNKKIDSVIEPEEEEKLKEQENQESQPLIIERERSSQVEIKYGLTKPIVNV